MTQDVRMRLKQELAHAASKLGVDYGEFRRQRQVDDFLIDGLKGCHSPEAVAARALVELCTAEKQERRLDFVVMIAVVRFLDAELGEARREEYEQRMKDLASLVDERVAEQQYLGWARSWYR